MNRGTDYCVNCKYWYCYDYEHKVEQDGCILEGECHRYPPSMPVFANSSGHEDMDVKELIIALYRQVPVTSYPYTYSDEWCGEFVRLDKLRDVDGFDCEWSDE